MTRTLTTAEGETVRLDEYRLRLGAREWSVLHSGRVISWLDEQRFLGERRDKVPYGVTLWPAAIALAHEVASRAESRPDAWRGARVLELGAGTGLPGIVAATFGARVVQTDRQPLALEMCRDNGARNGVTTVEYRLADWTAWDDVQRYDWILGSDVLYAEKTHEQLRRILATNLAPGGRALLSDPFRKISMQALEAMEAEDGWSIAYARWSVGDEKAPRKIGVYELTRALA